MNPHIAARKLITLLSAEEDQGRQSPLGNDRAHLLFLLWSIHRGDVRGEKAHRWLGYAQGLIVLLGLGSLEAMKSLNLSSQDGSDTERQRRISLLDARKSLVTGDDGYVIFWPTSNIGAYTSYDLREIAEEIDKRNKEWDDSIKADPRISGENDA
jgi:hypothetical protein